MNEMQAAILGMMALLLIGYYIGLGIGLHLGVGLIP